MMDQTYTEAQLAVVAKLSRQIFDAFRAQDFTEQQSMELVKTFLSEALRKKNE